MNKTQAIKLFDNNRAAMAKALGITVAAISNWPGEHLPERHRLKIQYVLLPKMVRRK